MQVRSDPTEHRPLSGGAGGMCGTDSCDDIKAALLVRIEELKVSFPSVYDQNSDSDVMFLYPF